MNARHNTGGRGAWGLALASVCLGLAACNPGGAERAGTARIEDALTTASAPITPDVLRTAGELVWCTSVPNAPFSEQAENGLAGFDIDVGEALSEIGEVQAEWKVIDYADLATGAALADGSCDAMISAIPASTTRSRSMVFTTPYHQPHYALATAPDSDPTSFDTIAGQRIGVQLSSAAADYLATEFPRAEPVPLSDIQGMYDALADGRADAVLAPSAVVRDDIADGAALQIAAEYPTGEKYAVAVAPGRDDLRKALSATIYAADAGGVLAAIEQKYFRTSITATE